MKKTIAFAVLLLAVVLDFNVQVLLAALHKTTRGNSVGEYNDSNSARSAPRKDGRNRGNNGRDKSNSNGQEEDLFRSGVSITGRVFVTMFGYPSNCDKNGAAYPCTLSLACWLSGGSSHSGCGGNRWLVACCVKIKTSPKNDLVIPQNDVEIVDEALQQKLNGKLEQLGPQRRINEIDDCGLSSDRIMLKRIIGGSEARFAQFPWQAHIKISAYQCGGVLVSRRFVATAAHCIIKARLAEITVYLGELDTQDTGKVLELAPAELHRVKRRIIHPKFQFRITQPDRYDLALLELVTEAGMSYHILPICLPEREVDINGKRGVVAGWGKIKPSIELSGTNVLRSATVPILDIDECKLWHEAKVIYVELYDEMLCAGHEDGHQDACLGDSGGPLIALHNGRWTLIGITSAGFGCGEPFQPGIYHSVQTTADWIRAIIYA